jgi:prophage tail gpP-like protein
MTLYQLLEEMARSVQVLLWDDPQGRLVLSKVGTKRAKTPLVEGINVEAATAQYSMDQRYHEIRVLGQVGQLSPTRPGIHENYLGTALDPDVRNGRLLVIIMDQVGIDGDWPRKRANWEIGRRYGRSRQIQVTVTGWRGADGQLWTPNTIVSVKCPTLKMNEDLVISEAMWMRGEQGTQTMLTLMPAKGLMPAPFLFTPVIPGFAGGATSA